MFDVGVNIMWTYFWRWIILHISHHFNFFLLVLVMNSCSFHFETTLKCNNDLCLSGKGKKKIKPYAPKIVWLLIPKHLTKLKFPVVQNFSYIYLLAVTARWLMHSLTQTFGPHPQVFSTHSNIWNICWRILHAYLVITSEAGVAYIHYKNRIC